MRANSEEEEEEEDGREAYLQGMVPVCALDWQPQCEADEAEISRVESSCPVCLRRYRLCRSVLGLEHAAVLKARLSGAAPFRVARPEALAENVLRRRKLVEGKQRGVRERKREREGQT